jgi:hypothetical protein
VRLIKRITCECGWTSHAFSKRGAALERDRHRGVCPKRSNYPITDSGMQYLLCHYRPTGCAFLIKFNPGQHDAAQQSRKIHESICLYR